MEKTEVHSPYDKETGLTPNMHPNYENVINELADELVYNYLANSFGDDGYVPVDYDTIACRDTYNIASNIDWLGLSKSPDLTVGKYFNERRNQRKRCRNIVIIGAGASCQSKFHTDK